MVHHSCCNKQKVKRGLWSPEEDEKLIKYISNYGHGCWSTVPRLAGLQRCGKSCRLRWINYLRPDLKRGSFSTQEAALMIELHKILGNRWAQIAKHLPGRTDNEVKNFWNSSIKKKLISHQNLSDFTSALISPNLPNSISNTNIINTNISCENLYFLNPNNNLIPNYQIDQIPIPNPPLISQDFDPPEFRVLDQVMNYATSLVSTPPPTNIHLISSSAYDHPSIPLGYNYHPQFIDNHEQILLKQEDNFIFSSDNPSSTLFHDKFLINPTLEIINQGCDQDSSLMLPVLPKLSEILKWNEHFGMPFSSCSQEQVVESILGISASGFSTSDENYACSMHVPHSNVEPIMELFLPSSTSNSSSSSSSASSSAASSLPASLLTPPPCTGTFLLDPNLPASWGPSP